MADTAKLKEVRDAQLDALLEAFTDYIDKQIKRKENDVELLENILKGHNTPTAVSASVIDTVTVLAERDLSKFLAG